ncbi:MAG: hypothetical protein AAF907_14765, partial [Planctomycetota bacterium]
HQVLERGGSLADDLSAQLDGLLDGRDMAAENLANLLAKSAARRALLTRVNNRGEDVIPVNESPVEETPGDQLAGDEFLEESALTEPTAAADTADASELERISTVPFDQPMFGPGESAEGVEQIDPNWQERLEPIELDLDRPSRAKALATLDRMSRFINSKRTVRFRIGLRAKEQATMGYATRRQTYDVAIAPGTNRLSIRFDNPDLILRSDGRDLMQVRSGAYSVSPAPARLEDFQRLPMMREIPSRAFTDNVAFKTLRLLGVPSIDSKLDRWDLSYVGEAEVDGVRADHLRIVGTDPSLAPPGDLGTGPFPPQWLSTWDLYVAQGDEPTPLYVRPDLTRWIAPQVWGPERVSDSQFVFSDWTFDDPTIESEFRHRIPADSELVDDVRFRPSLSPFIGKPLPTFEVADENGAKVRSGRLIDGRPTVVYFYDHTLFAPQA